MNVSPSLDSSPLVINHRFGSILVKVTSDGWLSTLSISTHYCILVEDWLESEGVPFNSFDKLTLNGDVWLHPRLALAFLSSVDINLFSSLSPLLSSHLS